MTKPITYYIDTPSIQAYAEQWGWRFEKLSVIDRFGLIQRLAYCAKVVVTNGEADLYERGLRWENPQINEFLQYMDNELTSPGQLAALIAGLADGLMNTVYACDQVGVS